MSTPLDDLIEYVRVLPLSEAAKVGVLERVANIGAGAPQAAGGSRYDELRERLTGANGRYPAPSGPAQPPPPPPPPVVPEDPPAFASGLDDEAPDTERNRRR